jgi:hypothetical protein
LGIPLIADKGGVFSNPPLSAIFLFFVIPASSAFRQKSFCWPNSFAYRALTGVHMGSSQVLPAFFANLSLSFAPFFLMFLSSSLL